ncbi:MAG TPA: ThiF family adenylyltransferase [Desulfobacteria bacterium]|nr:ThiF family adenylyltransferase [Desulfobacteria bacterium]
MVERYSRQILFPGIGLAGQHKLRQAKVAIVGVGALGTVSANNLVRAGVGLIRVIDRDFVEYSNLQRQTLFDEDDASKAIPKAVAAVKKMHRINSDVQGEAVIADLNPGNVLDLLRDIDLVVDGTDNFETRFVVNDACWKLNIPWVYGGAVGSSGVVAAFVPGQTVCLRCLFDSSPGPGFAPTCDTAGIINPASGLVASLQTAEALKILVGALAKVSRDLVSFDLWENRYDSVSLTNARSEDCPCCGKGDYTFLRQDSGTQTAYLCGRDAVQIVPAGVRSDLDLNGVAKRLSGVVQVNNFLLRLIVDRYELVLFKDGRAIIKGTNNEGQAKGLYARYFGL